MGSTETDDYTNNEAGGHTTLAGQKKERARAWHFDTLQVHAGLEESPIHGQCTLPVYNTASFKFKTTAVADDAFENAMDSYIYSRCQNPSNKGFERRMAALEAGKSAVSFSSGASAVLSAVMALAQVGDNVIVSCHVHGGTFHQFQVVLGNIGIQSRFCDTNDVAKVLELIDDKTKLIFTESLGNPKLSVADLEPLAAAAHGAQLPLVVDATFTAGGYFCQPAKWGADIIIHSATKWIGGHGTTLGGVVIETGRSDWQANAVRFPQLHGMRPGREGVEASLYARIGNLAFAQYLKWDLLRDTGGCMSPLAAQQLFIGVETLSLRCARQANNAAELAAWLRTHPRVAWVQYPGFKDHPYHQLANKYFRHGFGTVLTFGLKGGAAEGHRLVDAFQLVINTANVGDAKTIIGHHWSTTHKQCTAEENETMGVYEDLFRLSLGIEDIGDIIADFEQAFERVKP